MKLTRIGLIVNPSAGGGAGLRIAAEALAALAPVEVWAGAGEMGAGAARGRPLACYEAAWAGLDGRARTAALAQRFAAAGLDALVVVGGDGTLADVAFALHLVGFAAPILGIGAGSANVGPLMACQGGDVGRLAAAHLVTQQVDGLIAGANGCDLGLGFNDVVIATTVLATVGGVVMDVDAAGKMQGRNVPAEPGEVWTAATQVIKRRAHAETRVAQGDQVATVIVGLPDERFYGKAIAGGVLLSSLLGAPAGCLACDHLLVRTHLDPEAYRRSEPVVSRYVSLDEDEVIEAWGFRPGTALCADGNPLLILEPGDRVRVRVRRSLATAIRIQGTR